MGAGPCRPCTVSVAGVDLPGRLQGAAPLGRRRTGAGGPGQHQLRIVGWVAHEAARAVACHGRDRDLVRSPRSIAVEGPGRSSAEDQLGSLVEEERARKHVEEEQARMFAEEEQAKRLVEVVRARRLAEGEQEKRFFGERERTTCQDREGMAPAQVMGNR